MIRKSCILALSLLSLLVPGCSGKEAGRGAVVIAPVSLDAKNDLSVTVTSSAGRVLAFDPEDMPDDITPDLILVTYNHHLDLEYYGRFPKARLFVSRPESLDRDGVRIEGVAAGHSEQPIYPDHPNHIIWVAEVDGVRIADLSCCGQKELTPGQLTALGRVDVALVLADALPLVIDVERSAAFVRQLAPRTVIALSHHYSDFDAALEAMSALTGRPVERVDGEFKADAESLKRAEGMIIQIFKAARGRAK